MKQLLIATLAASLVAAFSASQALAKGPSEASIDGPGLSAPVVFSGTEASGPLGELTQEAGFFPAAFGGQVPDPMLKRRPSGDLGPRYVVRYVVPGPYGEEDVLHQDLYPYAEPAPVSYMAPGQPVFGTRKTYGGWFVASPQLKHALVAAGLPPNPPGGDGSPFPWTVVGALLAVGAVFAGAAVVVVLVRRRPHPAV
jgi:hypothetical protein